MRKKIDRFIAWVRLIIKLKQYWYFIEVFEYMIKKFVLGYLDLFWKRRNRLEIIEFENRGGVV